MPDLDRRIVVRICESRINSYGEVIPNPVDHDVWAMLVESGVDRVIGEGGVQGYAGRRWRVRFDQRFVDAQEQGETIEVTYGNEEPDRVTKVGETVRPGPLRRRRFLDLVT